MRMPSTIRAASTEVETAVDGSMGVGRHWMLGQQGRMDDGATNGIENILCEMLVSVMEEVEIRLRVEERR